MGSWHEPYHPYRRLRDKDATPQGVDRGWLSWYDAGWNRAGAPEPYQGPSMLKWEYKFLELPWKQQECVEKLNELGQEGWEVLAFNHGVGEDNSAFLRRPVESKS